MYKVQHGRKGLKVEKGVSALIFLHYTMKLEEILANEDAEERLRDHVMFKK